jgi:hypothetical protein
MLNDREIGWRAVDDSPSRAFTELRCPSIRRHLPRSLPGVFFAREPGDALTWAASGIAEKYCEGSAAPLLSDEVR